LIARRQPRTLGSQQVVAGAIAVFEPWDESPSEFLAWLRARGWLPSEFQQRRAIDELLNGEWRHELVELASRATVLHALYRRGVAGEEPIRPRWLAMFAGVAVVATVSQDESSWDPTTRAASIPTRRSAARAEWDTLHETAHAVLFPADDHPSVQRLAALLAVDRATYQATVSRRGPGGAVVRLANTHDHLPPFVVAASCLFWGRLDQ
jgi:hypothetical protein